jgi:hypothetical protein
VVCVSALGDQGSKTGTQLQHLAPHLRAQGNKFAEQRFGTLRPTATAVGDIGGSRRHRSAIRRCTIRINWFVVVKWR